MIRVLLIHTNQLQAPYPVPPLGLALLAERLQSLAEVRIHDGTFHGAEGLTDTLQAFAPDVVGLGIRNIDNMVPQRIEEYLDGIEETFVRPIRASGDAILVLGGAGFSLFPQALMQRFEADHGVVGEGEEAFASLIEALSKGRPTARLHTRVCGSPAAGETGASRLERWVALDPYRDRGSYPIQTKRGCAQRCVYCTYPGIEGTSYRCRDPEAIADEIEAAAQQVGTVGGDMTFEFVDSVFNDPPGHAEAVCDAVARRATPVRLRTMGLNPRGVGDDLLVRMRRAGFTQVDCTPDSAAPAVLRGLRKGFAVEDLEAAAGAIRRARMPCMWFLLFGGPGETARTFDQTLSFIDRSVDPEDLVYMAAGLRIYPNTPLRRLAIEQGVVEADDDLVRPRFYFSPDLGEDDARERILEAARQRPNCVPSWETRPPPELMRRARELHRGPGDPMFRAMLRARAEFLRDGKLTTLR